MRVILLGPQRRPTVDAVSRAYDPGTRWATVTAGWQEREPDDAELDTLLDGNTVNLGLYGRWLDLQERDREYAIAELEHRTTLDELRMLHLVQLDSALGSLYALARRTGDRPRVVEAALSDAVEVIRLVDDRHVERVVAATAEFRESTGLADRPAVVEHRESLRGILADTDGLVVAGGHVGVLLRLMRLFAVAPLVPDIVVAWSAGAMALTDRVVLFHDRTPQGRSPMEIYDDGLGVIRGAVLLPDARRRLIVDDAMVMAAMARRFAPARCVVLDEGQRVELTSAGELPGTARVIRDDGRLATLEDA